LQNSRDDARSGHGETGIESEDGDLDEAG